MLVGVDGTTLAGLVRLALVAVVVDESIVYSKLTAVADAGKFDKSV